MKAIEEMTIGEAKEELEKSKKQYETLSELFNQKAESIKIAGSKDHPMINKRCLIRTYSAGVHIGDIVYINPENSMELKLENALRLWKWEGGGLSLSVVANNGIKGGRLNKTGEVYLTNVIEIIPTNEISEKTYANFIEG